jgi:hypothetical protein
VAGAAGGHPYGGVALGPGVGEGGARMLGFWGFGELGWYILLVLLVALIVVYIIIRKKQSQKQA